MSFESFNSEYGEVSLTKDEETKSPDLSRGYASHLARIYDSRNSFFGERLNPQADA